MKLTKMTKFLGDVLCAFRSGGGAMKRRMRMSVRAVVLAACATCEKEPRTRGMRLSIR